MARRAVLPSLWSGSDRVRIGERLQASLAGILELELLRDTQKGTVESALGIWETAGAGPGRQRQQGWGSLGAKEPLPPVKLDRSKSEDLLGIPEKPCVAYCSSESIDVGLQAGTKESRTPGMSLGLRAIGFSEQLLLPKRPRAQVEPSFTAPETSEADSRPSSGFYETSEMGSLSDSSMSMHSECPGGSYCSVGSLSHLPGLRDSGCVRPHSTDEATVRLLDLRLQRVTAPNAPSGPHAAARRPVSTGIWEMGSSGCRVLLPASGLLGAARWGHNPESGWGTLIHSNFPIGTGALDNLLGTIEAPMGEGLACLAADRGQGE
nr:dapper homolog 2-like isoform X1 [Pelodiscus sinensis]|eukprot:XP_025035756.1 dapper homolog 2-like isoform X1 [Pelodiscus sinensis]